MVLYVSDIVGVLVVGVGVLVGVFLLFFIYQIVLYEYFVLGCDGVLDKQLVCIWLFVIVIILYNFLEGFVVGVGFVGGEMVNGLLFVLGIGI